MFRFTFALTLLVAACVVAIPADQTHAQKPMKYSQRYSPRRPTLSPYLNYFRRDSGLLDNYNAFVAPRQRLQSRLQTQEAVIYQQQQQLRQVQNSVSRYRQAGAGITGTHSTFMNYSHYFQQR